MKPAGMKPAKRTREEVPTFSPCDREEEARLAEQKVCSLAVCDLTAT
jgi:hypothetical protein